MRFLTRSRIGFRVGGVDRQTRDGKPRCTRWWKIWPSNARVVIDFQHTTVMGPPYWQARLRVGRYGLDFSTQAFEIFCTEQGIDPNSRRPRITHVRSVDRALGLRLTKQDELVVGHGADWPVVGRAQEALTAAREQARRQLEDLRKRQTP